MSIRKGIARYGMRIYESFEKYISFIDSAISACQNKLSFFLPVGDLISAEALLV